MSFDHQGSSGAGVFAVRGNLDGDDRQEFVEREQFIGLKISEDLFYLGISEIKEIIMLQPITFVPGSVQWVEGVINLRGTIIPALNLRKMMRLPRGEVTASTRIVIVTHGQTQVGIVVDMITYVVALLPTEIEERALSSKTVGADLISRIATRDQDIIGILDLNKILTLLKPENDDEESAEDA
ncbi:MAG: chemotaxis protein CheW [Oligoflexales bacterium]